MDAVIDRTETDPKKVAARHAVENALRRGEIVAPKKCEGCGATGKKLQAHHHKGYAKEHALDVKWLCPACNSAERSKRNAAKDEDDAAVECPECGKLSMAEGQCMECGYTEEACAGTKKKALKDAADGPSNTVQRFDMLESMEWMTSPFTRTPEGFLRGRAIVTNTGVFTYRDANGMTHTELRLPEEVFDSQSIDSLRLKPVVNNHPAEIVTPENVKQYQVGSLGDNPGSTTDRDMYGERIGWKERTDNYHLAIDVIVHEAGAIQDVLNGKRALSCGYQCDLEEAPKGAVWCGMPYDYIQRRIRYNHVAIVDNARAGDAARIRLDSSDAVLVKNSKEVIMDLKKITMDGVEYQAEGPVIASLSKANERADAAEKALKDAGEAMSKVEAERDSFKERNDALTKELEVAKAAAVDQARVDAAVSKKMALIKAAEKAGIEIKADMKDADVQKAVILKVFPVAQLDGKDEIYLSARFDAAVEVLETAAKNDSETSALLGTGTLPNNDKQDEYNADAARQRMIDRMNKRPADDK